MSAVFVNDGILPIVYDCVACEAVANTTLLECPRRVLAEEEEREEGLGVLISGVVGRSALKGVVGVSCQGMQNAIDNMEDSISLPCRLCHLV